MATEEDTKDRPDDDSPPAVLAEREDDAALTNVPDAEAEALTKPVDGEDLDDGVAPTQLGFKRFVYAAYFAGGIAVAFLLSKAIGFAWLRLALWKPLLGEPRDEIVMPIAAVVGALVAIYYYRDIKTRTLAEEVASELAKVTWPRREEVVNSTFVVIVTTLVATTFFALMDRFWGFVTNLVYGA